MRYITLILFALTPFFLFSCQEHGTEPTGPYDSMFLERTGAMDLGFNVSPSASVDTFQINVTHREFRDTTIQMILVRNDTSTRAFDALTTALKGQAQIYGNYKESMLPQGTWVKVFMIKDVRRQEVTNVELRNLLLPFEQMVRSSLNSTRFPAP